MNATRVEELPEIGAVHVLAVDIFMAVQQAYYPNMRHRLRDWTDLPTTKKVEYIAAAKTLIERYRPAMRMPASVAAFPQPQDAPALCIYCTAEPVDLGFDPYCSARCAISAENY